MNTPIRISGAPIVFWITIAYHISAGITMLLTNNPQLSAALAGQTWLWEFYDEQWAYSATLWFGAALAFYGTLHERTNARNETLALMAPQYVIVVVSIFSDIGLLLSGTFNDSPFNRLDGYEILAIYLMVAIGHTYAVIERYLNIWPQTRLR